MNSRRYWAKLLLWLHLFVCLVWLFLFHANEEPPGWMMHVFVLSILAIQFTWSFTVGLIIGPSRKRRPLLWWSLLTISMPIFFVSRIFVIMCLFMGLPIALLYLGAMVAILACETYGGVLLGVGVHAGKSE